MEQEIITSLFDVGDYNGWEEELKNLYAYIKKNSNLQTIPFPDFLREYDCNHYLRVVWSVFVLSYGDYGTSPRFGWLQGDKINELLVKFEKYFE